MLYIFHIQYFHTIHIFRVYSYSIVQYCKLNTHVQYLNRHIHFNAPLKHSNILSYYVLMPHCLHVDTTLWTKLWMFPYRSLLVDLCIKNMCAFSVHGFMLSRRGRPIWTLISNYENGFPTCSSIECLYTFHGEHPYHPLF